VCSVKVDFSERDEVRKGRGKFILITLTDESWPIADRGRHAAAVDEVEVSAVLPVGFDVINFEMNIRRHPVWSSALSAPHKYRKVHLYQRGWIGLRSLPKIYQRSSAFVLS